jgi:N-acetyl-anhydromuramyl-L-alanine amidase AmpD
MDSFFVKMENPKEIKVGETATFRGLVGNEIKKIEITVDNFFIGKVEFSKDNHEEEKSWEIDYVFASEGDNRQLELFAYDNQLTRVLTRQQVISVKKNVTETQKPSAKIVESKVKHLTQGIMECEGLVVHYTAGQQTTDPSGAIGMANAAEHAPYAYWVMAADGTIYKTHELNLWGYHCGTSHHRTHLGIEIMCPGKLVKVGENFYPWYNLDRTGNPKGNPWPSAKIRYFGGNDVQTKGFYAKYTDEQEKALVGLVQHLKDSCPKFKIDNVVGHDEILPDYKDDPGGSLSMSMPAFREHLKKVIV